MSRPQGTHRLRRKLVATAAAVSAAGATAIAGAQTEEGGLYIAGAGFSFAQAAAHALGMNPAGQRFFLLSVPPETRALETTATGPLAAVRDRVIAAGATLYICQRDVDNRKINPAALVPGVIAVRGWPPPGSTDLPADARYFPGENPGAFPASNEALRRLRATCSD
jgi:hypothetical protein